MTFDATGTTSLNVLLGDKAIVYPPSGQPVTYAYKAEDLVSDAETAVYGKITLFTFKERETDIFDQTGVIVDWRDEAVYFLDKTGNYRTCPATIINQGAMVTVRWDCEESGILDESGKNDRIVILENLVSWSMTDGADEYSRITIITNNLGKLV